MLFGKKKPRKEIKTKKNDDSYFLFFRVSVSEKIILNWFFNYASKKKLLIGN